MATARSSYRGRLWAALAVKTLGHADLLVAICTRDRVPQLSRALESVMRQTRAPTEILVVDNAPKNDAARRLVRDRFPTVRYTTASAPGLDFARNRALQEASQDLVAFLDDDAVAEPTWVAETEAVFWEDPRIAICTGRVEALSEETAGQRLFEANGGFARGDLRISLPQDARHRRLHGLPAPLAAWSISVGSGCSMAVRRREILSLGGFDEALDLGPALPGGGDLDMIWRALEAGHMVVYEPRVRARHEHRRRVEETIDQILEHNRSLIVFLSKAARSARGRRRLGVVAFLGWRLVKPLLRVGRGLIGWDVLPLSALVRLCGASWRGLGAYSGAVALAEERGSAARESSV